MTTAFMLACPMKAMSRRDKKWDCDVSRDLGRKEYPRVITPAEFDAMLGSFPHPSLKEYYGLK